MKKKIVRLTESDVEKMVLRIINEMDYVREIDNNDFRFLNKPEFKGWVVEQNGDEFIIKNPEYRFFEFAVSLNDMSRHGESKQYPWRYEARRTGGGNLPSHYAGHQNKYAIELNATSNLENTFKHFLHYNYNELNKMR